MQQLFTSCSNYILSFVCLGIRQSMLVTLSVILVFSSCNQSRVLITKAEEQKALYKYSVAEPLYEKLYEHNPGYEVVKGIAECAWHRKDYAKSQKWYAILDTFSEATYDDHVNYTDVLIQNGAYHTAARYMSTVTGKTEDRNLGLLKLQVLAASCHLAAKEIEMDDTVRIKLAGFNSPYSDFGAVLYFDHIIFSSDRLTDTITGKKGKRRPFLTFRTSSRSTKRFEWTGNSYLRLYDATTPGANSVKYATIGSDMHEKGFHVSSIAVADYKNRDAYFVANKPEKTAFSLIPNDEVSTIRFALYKTLWNNTEQQWTDPVLLNIGEENKYSIADPFVSQNGRLLLFVANTDSGFGGTDIYYCTRAGHLDQWSSPVSLGYTINTFGNERSPFLTQDSILYFASDGRAGFGGLDIFSAVYTKDGWVVKNAGKPLNSAQDDFAISFKDHLSGFFSSNRLEGVGSDDIYTFEIHKKLPKYIRILVKEHISGKPIANAQVKLTSRMNAQAVLGLTSHDGYVEFPVKDTVSLYTVSTSDSGFVSSNVDIALERMPIETGNDRVVYTTDITLSRTVQTELKQEPQIGETVRLEHVYFDRKKALVRNDAIPELTKLADFLTTHPSYIVEIASYTDSRGNDETNLALSYQRSNAVVDWLAKHGVDRSKLYSKGYGETRLLNNCSNGIICDEKSHALNRRTEFKLLGK